MVVTDVEGQVVGELPPLLDDRSGHQHKKYRFRSRPRVKAPDDVHRPTTRHSGNLLSHFWAFQLSGKDNKVRLYTNDANLLYYEKIWCETDLVFEEF